MNTRRLALGFPAWILALTVALGAQAGTVLQVDVEYGTTADVQTGFDEIRISDNLGGGDDGASKTYSSGITVDVDGVGFALGGNHRHRSTPVDGGALTQGAIYRDFVFSGNDSPSYGLDTTITGLKPGQYYDVTVWSFDISSAGTRVSDWYTRGGLGRAPAKLAYTFDGNTPPTADEDNRFTFSAYADKTGQLVIEGRGNLETTGGSPALFLNGFQLDERTGWELVLAVDFNDRSYTGSTYTQGGFDEFVITGSPTTQTFGSIDVTLSGINSGLDDRHRTLPTDGGAFTQQELLRDFVLATSYGNDEGLEVLVEGLDPATGYEVTLWSFDDGSGSYDRPSDWYANGVLVDNWVFNGDDISSSNPTPPDNGTYSFSFVAASNADGEILIQGLAPSGFSGPAVFLNAMTIASVPEPATAALFGLGIVGLFPLCRRHRRRPRRRP